VRTRADDCLKHAIQRDGDRVLMIRVSHPDDLASRRHGAANGGRNHLLDHTSVCNTGKADFDEGRARRCIRTCILLETLRIDGIAQRGTHRPTAVDGVDDGAELVERHRPERTGRGVFRIDD